MLPAYVLHFFFFFNDTATTEIYTLSLHDALPISLNTCRTSSSGFTAPQSPRRERRKAAASVSPSLRRLPGPTAAPSSADRKSTRLNSSHGYISYAVFCLKKKKKRSKQ